MAILGNETRLRSLTGSLCSLARPGTAETQGAHIMLTTLNRPSSSGLISVMTRSKAWFIAMLPLFVACSPTSPGESTLPESTERVREALGYPLQLKALQPSERTVVGDSFMTRSALAWDTVSVNIFGHVTAAIRDDRSLIPADASFDARKSFWTSVLHRLSSEEVQCVDLGCQQRRVSSATIRAGHVQLFWQLNHTTKATLTQSSPPIRAGDPPMTDEALTQVAQFELPESIQAPFGIRSCPRCNQEFVMVDTKVTGIRWQRGHMIVMNKTGTLHAREFASPIITMTAVPPAKGEVRQWTHHPFQDGRLSHRKIDTITGEDLSALVCLANSGHPALACGDSQDKLTQLSALLFEHTTWRRDDKGLLRAE